MGMDTLSDMVLGSFKFGCSLALYLGELFRAKRPSILTKTGKIKFELRPGRSFIAIYQIRSAQQASAPDGQKNAPAGDRQRCKSL